MNTYIVSAVRTPVGKYGRSFLDVPAVELGRIAVEEAIKRAGIKKELVDEVIMGNVLQCGLGQNPARQWHLSLIPQLHKCIYSKQVCGSASSCYT
jgi:acetyl-CoA acetyltransferase (EC 2.3.1.9)